jgi:HEAT repeat protein
MSAITEIPFAQVLDKLFGSEPISIPLLFRLSDLAPEDLADFSGRWPQVDAERRRMIIRHLADISEDNFEVDFGSIFAFCLQDDYAPARLAALDGLEHVENPAYISPLIACLTADPGDEARAAAAAALGHFLLLAEWGQLPTPRARAALEALLTQYQADETPTAVKRAALESLGGATDERIPPLIRAAYQTGDTAWQLSAIFAMGRSADDRWSSIIRQELSSPLERIRLEAVQAAGGLGDEALVADVAELLTDEELEVQLAAVAALGLIGGELAQEYLTELADDPDAEELHEAIQEALDEMGWFGGEIDFSIL